MAETRARRRIRKAVESRGYSVVEIDWEPIGVAMEMCGPDGGWLVEVSPSYYPDLGYREVGGYSVDEVLAQIDYWLEPSRACECDQMHPGTTQRRMPDRPLRDDPERGLHDPSCRWHIPYRLRWWNGAPRG